MKTIDSKIKKITITAVLAALITLMTAYVCHIPVPIAGGYIHVGDSLIYLAACLLPRPYAMVAAAIGGGMADLLTAPMWTIPTMIIKPLITLPFTGRDTRLLNKRNLIAPLFAYFISATGYFLAEAFIFGAGVAFLTSVAASFIQSFGSAVIFLIFATALDKMNFKSRTM